jgi:hypothetical protein
VTAAATIGIAATPLDSPVGGLPHAVAAGIAYASLAATPLLSAPSLAAAGQRKAAVVSLLAGGATAACLGASAVVEARTGLWQRTGFLIGDAWLIASAIYLNRRHSTLLDN